MKIALLGPEGTFSHEVALKLNKSAKMVFVDSIWDVFEELEKGKVECGIVPVENSIEGGVGITLDALMEFDQKVKKEIILPVRHCLCGFGTLREVKEVYSHPQALSQCRKFLNSIKAKTFQTTSTSMAASEVARMKDRKKACICSKLAAKIYGLKIIREDVQDEKNNMTRFFLLQKTDSEPSGNDKTSLAVYPEEDRPGLLHEILGVFAKRKINLTRIESRPSKRRLGEYIFFIDVNGHGEDKEIKEALEELRKKVKNVKVFGSYPTIKFK
jgi:prephenate dehydratase